VKCLDQCLYFNVNDGELFCKLYNKTLDIEFSDAKYTIQRCEECSDSGDIGYNTCNERVNLLKKHVGWLSDIFYSFKDDYETILSDVYRVLKKMEKDNEKELVQEPKND
jgi:hypothetical protein